MAEAKTHLSGGHVYCRVFREDRDIRQCLECIRLKQVAERASPPYLVCDAEIVDDPSIGDPRFVEWWYQHHRRGR